MFELWGASGGCYKAKCSKGAYVSGIIELKERRKLFLFIGERGSLYDTTPTFNGGGAAYYGDTTNDDIKKCYSSSGGGATDIRYKDGNWNDIESLKTRIMVASGGGGESNFYESSHYVPAKGANGGTLRGENSSRALCYQCTDGSYTSAGGGEQEKGGKKGGGNDYGWGKPGSLGRGADAAYGKDKGP